MTRAYYFLAILMILTSGTLYQNHELKKKILKLEYIIDDVDCHLENRIIELETKINELESKSEDHYSRIDDLETKTMFMD